MIPMDAMLIEQVIINLLENAIIHSRSEKPIDCFVTCDERYVTFHVRDYGIGIPEDSQSRVFERFYRVDKSRSKGRGGTGLGLSIVKHGAAFHGAQLKLESTLGEGTKISVIFPVK